MSKTYSFDGKPRSLLSVLIHAYHPRTWREKGILYATGVLLATYLLVVGVLWFLWDSKPSLFEPREIALAMAGGDERKLVAGYVTTATVIQVADTLLDKPGGYLSNDRMPPGVFMDNVPNWEFGVLTAIRDISRSLRNDFSRSQTQSREDLDLQVAEPKFNFDNNSWLLPPSESEYRDGIRALRRYLDRLADERRDDGQFFTRADNLRDYFSVVEKRLGSLSQRLSASVGHIRVNTNLAGDPNARQSTPTPQEQLIKSSWLEIDDHFYEARGYCWAMIEFLRAIEVDFKDVLANKNAQVSLRQIIHELEATQEPVWSPVILNGSGFALFANHSLVMASYIARANAALIDLRNLLQQG